MRSLLFCFLVFFFLMPTAVLATVTRSELALTSSADDFFNRNPIPTFTGTRIIYLWFGYQEHNVSRFEFSFVGDFEVVEVIPEEGFINTGTVTSPILELDSGSCFEPRNPPDSDFRVLAQVVIRDASGEGGKICLSGSQATGRLCFLECDTEVWWSPPWEGLTTSGNDYCSGGNNYDDGCQPTPVSKSTWGRIKALYQ